MSVAVPGVPRERRRTALRWWLRERRLATIGWSLIVLVIGGTLGGWKLGVFDLSPISQPPTDFGTEGANLVERGALGPDMEVGAVGEDQTRTYIIRKKGTTKPQPTVIMLHGFGSSIVAGYEPWIEHLANEGVTVWFPSWQQPPFPTDGTQNPRTNMFSGVELAAKAVPPIEGQVAVAGISAGAALAFDYAALGTRLNVPKTKLVYSVYPGRAFPGQKEPILPIPTDGGMQEGTKVITLVSRRDEEVGTRWGVEQYDELADRPDLKDQRELIYVTDRQLQSHYDPGKDDAAARAQFWKPLDTALTLHLGAKLAVDEPLRRSILQARKVKRDLKKDKILRDEAQKGTSATSAAIVTAEVDEDSGR